MSPQIISLAFSLCFCLVVSSADGEASGLCLSPGVDELLENLTSHYSQGVTISLETSYLSSALNCSLHQLDCGQSCQCLDLGRLCEDADCGTADPEVLTVEQYERTSVVLLYHLFHLSEACSNHSDSSRMMLTSYDEYHYWFMPNGTNITDTLHLMFHNLVELTENHDDHHEDHEDHDDNDDHDDHDEDEDHDDHDEDEDHDDHDHDDHDDHDEDEAHEDHDHDNDDHDDHDEDEAHEDHDHDNDDHDDHDEDEAHEDHDHDNDEHDDHDEDHEDHDHDNDDHDDHDEAHEDHDHDNDDHDDHDEDEAHEDHDHDNDDHDDHDEDEAHEDHDHDNDDHDDHDEDHEDHDEDEDHDDHDHDDHDDHDEDEAHEDHDHDNDDHDDHDEDEAHEDHDHDNDDHDDHDEDEAHEDHDHDNDEHDDHDEDHEDHDHDNDDHDDHDEAHEDHDHDNDDHDDHDEDEAHEDHDHDDHDEDEDHDDHDEDEDHDDHDHDDHDDHDEDEAHEDHDHDNDDHDDHDEDEAHEDHDHDNDDHDDHDEDEAHEDHDHDNDEHDDHDEDHEDHDHDNDDHDDHDEAHEDHDHDNDDHDDHDEDEAHEDHDHDNDDHDDHDEDEAHEDHDHDNDDHDDHDEDHEDHDHEDHDEDHGDDHHDYMCIDDSTFDHLFEDVEIDKVTAEYISGRTVLLIFQGYRFAHICDEHDVTPEAIYENLLSLLGIDNEFDRESLCELMGRLGIGEDECTMDDHDHDSHEDDHDSHEDHDDDDDHDDHDDHDHRKRREAGHLIQKRQADMAAIECLTVDDILSIYQITSPGITQSDFERLCPALLEQHLSDVCAVEEVDEKEGPTKAERYGYGTLAVAFITLCAIFGILLVLCNNHSGIKDSIMACLIALAVGTLSTDAILHLIPAAFGLHSHGASGEDDGHNHGDEGIKLSDYAQKGLLILAAFYALYLLEVLMSKLGHSRSRIHDGHSDTEASGIDQDSFNKTKIDNHVVSSNAIEMSETTPGNQTSCLSFRSIKPVAWMVLFGDGVHNFADGLAIGGAFSVSITSGVSTSLAILCHELPHELGDFAILLNSGFKPLVALFLNVLSALTAFIGLYVGLSLASDESARQWIFTLAAGMFLYIALADMIPELLYMLQKGPFWRIFIFQNIGLLLGCLILVLLNLYEEHIQV